jgi:hypothetical protein
MFFKPTNFQRILAFQIFQQINIFEQKKIDFDDDIISFWLDNIENGIQKSTHKTNTQGRTVIFWRITYKVIYLLALLVYLSQLEIEKTFR